MIVGMVMSVEERGGGGERGGDVERWLVAWLEGNGVVDPHGYFTRQLATMAHTQQVNIGGLYSRLYNGHIGILSIMKIILFSEVLLRLVHQKVGAFIQSVLYHCVLISFHSTSLSCTCLLVSLPVN